MKKVTLFLLLGLSLTTLLISTPLAAQTPDEIVQKMSEQMDRGDEEGFTMDMNMKMPIIGTVGAHSLVRGDKVRMEMNAKDRSEIAWRDATTKWTYNTLTGEVTIEPREASSSEGAAADKADLSTFDRITEGYTLHLQKETADAWYILCKKARTNKDKDDPKKMELAVAKATYLPIYLRMKKSFITVSIENVTIGVSEEEVTFNPADYPNAKIIDKR